MSGKENLGEVSGRDLLMDIAEEVNEYGVVGGFGTVRVILDKSLCIRLMRYLPMNTIPRAVWPLEEELC